MAMPRMPQSRPIQRHPSTRPSGAPPLDPHETVKTLKSWRPILVKPEPSLPLQTSGRTARDDSLAHVVRYNPADYTRKTSLPPAKSVMSPSELTFSARP